MFEQFITSILGEMTGNAIMGRSNGYTEAGKLKVDIFEWFAYPEELPKMVEYAKKWQDKDVYLSPMIYGNKRNSKQALSRSTDNALYAQTVFMDSDLCPPGAFRLKPSIHLDTSADHGHDYWQLPEPVAAKDAATVAHKITVAHQGDGCDPSGWSQNKVLRVPGTNNTGHGWPEPVTIQYNGIVYRLAEIDSAYQDVDLVAKKLGKTKTLVIPDSVTIPDSEDLPEYGPGLLEKMDRPTFELALKVPTVGEGGNRSEVRWKLLLELHRDSHGLTREEKLSIAWNAPSVLKWSQEDARGMDGLVTEYEQTLAIVRGERGENHEPVATVIKADRKVKLITDEERESIRHEASFIREYVTWCGEHLDKQNPAYDRINAWQILAVGFSDVAFIPRANGAENCNLYSITIGKTTTGKSQSLKLLRAVLKEIKDDDPEFDVGGNASESSLSSHLIGRDGKVSWFNKDEAQGLLRTWTEKEWAGGMLEIIALLYDGYLPAMLRTTNREQNGKSAVSYFSLWLQGTWSIVDVMTQAMVDSGFVPRFLFAIGEESSLEDEDWTETQSDGTLGKNGYDQVARQWSAHFRESKINLKMKSGSERTPIMMDQIAADRKTEANILLMNMIREHPRAESMKPAMIRMSVTIRKMATLLAAYEGSTMIHEYHMLQALEAAEEYVENLLGLVEKIADSEYKRNVDSIVAFVESRPQTRATDQQIYLKFSSVRKKDVDEYIGGAISQGYIIGPKSIEGKEWYIRNNN